MCGLVGSVNMPLGAASLAHIAHRGPDGEGLNEYSVGAHRVWLGHRRLAIVDLSPNGAQPMTTLDGRHAIAFNGEIYNHQNLRCRDTAYRGHSDTETLLYALAGGGHEVVKALNGIFAFAWLDVAGKRLLLVRDPFGVKPLYYAAVDRGFCFASELRPLLELAPRTVDRENLTTLLKLRFSPSPQTLFKGIQKLRPGHILEVALDGDQPKLREYSYIDSIQNGVASMPFDEAVNRYGELFTGSVQRQLMSDVEVGVMLSGGIDSALVAAVAARNTQGPLKAFTVGFKGEDPDGVDEIADAKRTAELLGLEHHTVRIGFEDFLEKLRECVLITEEPLATTSIVPIRFLAQLAARHVKVVLSGQGADELLGGYGRYQGELVASYVPNLLARLGRGFVRTAGLRDEKLTRGLDAFCQADEIGRFRETYAVFTDMEIEALTGTTESAARAQVQYTYDLLGCARLPSSVARMMSLDLRMGLADDLLLYTDKITMHSSIECRVPILDHELVRYVESLPTAYRVAWGRKKIIHGAFARRLLPSEIVERPRRGFFSPTGAWFRNTSVLRSLLLNRNSRFADYINLSAVERTLNEHVRGYNRERHIFLLLCLHYWLEEYG